MYYYNHHEGGDSDLNQSDGPSRGSFPGSEASCLHLSKWGLWLKAQAWLAGFWVNYTL